MPSYFEQDRFRPPTELLREIPSSGYVPQTHELNPNTTAVRARDPSLRQFGVQNAHSLVGMINDSVDWYVGLKKNLRIIDIRQDFASQLPQGKEYTLMITNPGGWSGPESIEIYNKGAQPNALHSPDTTVIYHNVGRTNPALQPGGTIQFKDSSGLRQTLVIPRPTEPLPATPPQRAKYYRNPVDREPHGLGLPREGRQLPADARFDRSYPGSNRFSRTG